MLRLVVSLMLLSGTALAQSLVWQDQFNLAGGLDQARALTVAGNTVVGVGPAVNASGGTDMLVRAYDGHTGTLTWSDSTPLVGGIITRVLADQTSGIVFTVGYSSLGTSTDFITRAYEPSSGNLLWQDLADYGQDDFPLDVATSPATAFVVGYGGNMPGGALDAIVRALDASTGHPRWTHQVDTGGEDVAWLVAYANGLAVVASTSAPDFLAPWNLRLTAYDEFTGATAWEVTQLNFLPSTMTIAGPNVVLSGFDSNGLGFTVAYDVVTGAKRWDNTERAFEVKAHGDQTVAIGQGIRLYSPTGEVLRTIPPDNDSEVHRIAVFGDTLYTVGVVLGPRPGDGADNEPPILELFTCAFDLNTGANVSDAHRQPEPGWTAFDMIATAQGLFIAGSVNNPQGDSDFLIQAFQPVSVEPHPTFPAPSMPPSSEPPYMPPSEPPAPQPPTEAPTPGGPQPPTTPTAPTPVPPVILPPLPPPDPVIVPPVPQAPPVVTPAGDRQERRAKIRNAKRARVAQISRATKRQPFNQLRHMRMH